jgi:hypothetical protein
MKSNFSLIPCILQLLLLKKNILFMTLVVLIYVTYL